MRIRLIQPRELFGPPERQEELQDCWNRSWGLFDSYQTPEGQPRFNELFDLCGEDMLNVIANADIFFDQDGIDLLRSVAPGPRTCYVLSRWDVDKDGKATLWDHRDSADVWIFNGKPQGIDAGYYHNANGEVKAFTMGVAGCDNRLQWLIEMAGYKVFNPSKSIKAYHLHNVQWRSYLVNPDGTARGGDKIERIPPPYGRCAPHTL